ncbi:hypothetical protein B4N84_10780 [Flavobacterium sp. IR1]|nr:hypothetical protein B4N84_10780 [Flavobacterium sp. IR1]
MKRALCVLSVALLVLVSCSKDNDSVVTPGDKVITDPIVKKEDSIVLPPVLVQKVIYKEETGDVINNVLYDGNKIKSFMSSDRFGSKYTYTGNFITKMEIMRDDTLFSTSEYTYNKGKLSTTTRKQPGRGFYDVTKYTHITDSTIAYAKYKVIATTETEEETGIMGRYTYRKGNLVKDQRFVNGVESISTNQFDTYNSPFKNVLGYNLLLGDENGYANNVIENKSISGAGGTATTTIITSAYKYDSNKYPTERVITYTSPKWSKTFTDEYVY